MDDIEIPTARTGHIRVHFYASDFDHEIKLSGTFVHSLPSVDVQLGPNSTVEQVVSHGMDLHARSGNALWTGRQAEAIVLFGGMGASGDGYHALGWHIYGVDAEGHLVVYDSMHDAIFVDVLRALSSGYLGSAPENPLLVVMLGAGWGGNGVFVADMVRWLGDVAPEVILAYLATKGLDHLSDAKQTKLRSLADKWARRKIDSPYVLREWIQSKDSWQASEVSQRLELNEDAARELLLALGYEDVGRGVLELRSSRDALARRDTWICQETSRFDDAMEDLVDPAPSSRGLLARLKRRRRR